MQAVQPCMRKASVRECETDWVCLFATHSCLRRSSLLLLLLPSSWHQCEYPADDVTTSPRGPDDAQSQARFPHKPLKHQNNLLSYWACVRDGMFEGTRGAVPLRSGWPQFMWSQFPIKHTFHSCLPPHGSFIGSARVGTSLHGPVWIWMLPVGSEQGLHYAGGVSCISMLFIHVFSPSGGKTKHYPSLCHCIDQHVLS